MEEGGEVFVNECQKNRVGIHFCHGVWRVVGKKCLSSKSVKGEEDKSGEGWRLEINERREDNGAGSLERESKGRERLRLGF